MTGLPAQNLAVMMQFNRDKNSAYSIMESARVTRKAEGVKICRLALQSQVATPSQKTRLMRRNGPSGPRGARALASH